MIFLSDELSFRSSTASDRHPTIAIAGAPLTYREEKVKVKKSIVQLLYKETDDIFKNIISRDRVAGVPSIITGL